jgi:nucleoside 2-deoxyribosyltransferase
MVITICSTIKFYPQIVETKEKLEAMGHEVLIPPDQVKNEKGDFIKVEEYYDLRRAMMSANGNENSWIWQRKKEAIRWHFEKVSKADAVLILNFEKNNIANYIGGNTFLEMGLACWLDKPIYLMNPIPCELSYTEEIKGMQPIVINEDLSLIK